MTEVWLLLRQRQAIEVDETFVGGPRRGRRRRGEAGKKIVAIAVEKPTGHVQRGFGRARIRVDGAWTLTDTAAASTTRTR
jgi:hypothetical protein